MDTGETFEDDADVLILARGMLSDPAWPKIPGLKSFKGEVMHSAIWKEEFVKRACKIVISADAFLVTTLEINESE